MHQQSRRENQKKSEDIIGQKCVRLIFCKFVNLCASYRTIDLNWPPPNWGQIHRDPQWANQPNLVALTSSTIELVNATIKYDMAPLKVGSEFALN